MAAVALAFRKVGKKCFHRIAVLRPISAPVHASPLPPQSSVESSSHPTKNVRNCFTQSACQGELKDALVDLKHGCFGQPRWYAGSNSSEKAKPDAELIATEMIKYAASCRNQGKLKCYRAHAPLVESPFHLNQVLHLHALHVNA